MMTREQYVFGTEVTAAWWQTVTLRAADVRQLMQNPMPERNLTDDAMVALRVSLQQFTEERTK